MYISFRLPLLPPRAKNHLAKPPNTKHEKLSSELLTSASQETPRTQSLLLLPLVTPPQRCKSLLLKIPYTSETGLRDP